MMTRTMIRDRLRVAGAVAAMAAMLGVSCSERGEGAGDGGNASADTAAQTSPERTDVPGTNGAWVEGHLEGVNEGVRAQLDAAGIARQEMFSALLTELMTAMNTSGAASAVEVCSERAPAIAEVVAASHGVRIGRTSFRLRNPENAPPPWATHAIEQRIERDAFYTHTDGRLATLTPIRLAPTCLACHGTPDELASGVPEALARRYPDDQATGFASGDLRGWFWVEVPAVELDDG